VNIAGLSAFRCSHAGLLQDGRLGAVAAEEWFTRRPRDPGLPVRALEWCCARAGVDAQRLDYVAFAEKPVQRFVRILGQLARGFPFTLADFVETLPAWLGDRLWLQSTLSRRLRLPPERLLFVERAVAQATAAFATSPFDEAEVLIVDDVGEWAATTLARGRRAAGRPQIELLREIRHPHALAFVQEALCRHLLLPDVGGVRWLAPLGRGGSERLRPQLEALVPPLADGAHALDLRCFRFRAGAVRFHPRAHALVGPPRLPSAPLSGDTGVDPRVADLVRGVQRLLADRIGELLTAARRGAASDNLCLGGSVLQDPWLAEQVLARAPFGAVHVSPLLGEAACALGAAAHAAAVIGEGGGVDLAAPVRPLDAAPGRAAADAPAAAAQALAAGEVVGWITGPPEPDGPALGRSVLLADPGNADAMARLARVRLAEPYVPPLFLTLPETLGAWTAPAARSGAAVGRIVVRPPANAWPGIGPATSPDGTVLLALAAPPLREVLQRFAAATQRPPVLAASSFHRAGEAPVADPAAAADLARRMGVQRAFWCGVDIAEPAG
jgi:carbamoyltransferase